MSGSKAANELSPSADEIEVSLFGPGFGECVVVHLGHGRWVVVDSCLHPESGYPVALHYLESLGLAPDEAICAVAATHWHDDHIHGLASVVGAAPNAKFVLSGAFSNPEFREVISPWFAEPSAALPSGVEELRKVRGLVPKPVLGAENKLIIDQTIGSSQCQMLALSPSDPAILATLTRLSDIPRSHFKHRLPRIEENHASVVFSIRVDDRRILLGADLQVRADRDFGWLAIVDSHKEFERARYEVFKIPHHGSANADHDEIWQQLLVKDAHSVVASFVGGRTKLPTHSDRKRIRIRTKHAWLTAPPTTGRFRHPNRTVEKTMKEAATEIQRIPHRFGQVRLRSKVSDQPGTWSVHLAGDAEPV